jgi:hypothetical protein
MLKRPEEDVVRWEATLVALLVAVTIALGTAAPVESVTVPVRVPSPAVWAWRDEGLVRKSIAANRKNAGYTALTK